MRKSRSQQRPMAKSPASNDTLGLPDTVYEELQRLRDLIRSDTVKRDLWANRFTAADRRKFAGPEKEVLKQHHTIELWHIARSTPTPSARNRGPEKLASSGRRRCRTGMRPPGNFGSEARSCVSSNGPGRPTTS